ncbi:hypothetical protein OSB04_011624 [Centaurea solstitialis]|uniref:Putative plant transposon protein domain-containing protein n=1 Tax=Centaurea solstitialis TaxID=347529 RepID=A0AA38T9S8_9ASTR|nr:hypothetical protein OSB04_011624 [Centaurea solstitialis]
MTPITSSDFEDPIFEAHEEPVEPSPEDSEESFVDEPVPKPKMKKRKKPPGKASGRIQRLLIERSFHKSLINFYPGIVDHLQYHGWQNIIPKSIIVNETLVREIYDTLSWLEGVPVTCSPEVINNLLGLKPPADCWYQHFKTNGTTFEQVVEMERLLLMDGRRWHVERNRAIMQPYDLDFISSYGFRTYDITSSQPDMMQPFPGRVNLGPIICEMLDDYAAKTTCNLIFPGLLTRMCTFFDVPTYDDDDVYASNSQIDLGTIRRMVTHNAAFASQVMPTPIATKNARKSRRRRPTAARPPMLPCSSRTTTAANESPLWEIGSCPVTDHVEKGMIELYFVNTEFQLENLFTKALDEKSFNFLITKFGNSHFEEGQQLVSEPILLIPWLLVFRIGKRELKYQLKFSESEIAHSPNRRTLLFRIGKLCFPNRKTSL